VEVGTEGASGCSTIFQPVFSVTTSRIYMASIVASHPDSGSGEMSPEIPKWLY